MMSEAHRDKTGAAVTVDLDEAGMAYTVTLQTGEVAGRAHYLIGPDADTERIFHHTVVDEEFGGRGLAKILVSAALADCREKGLTVIPVCSVFGKKLQETGDDYQAEGGRFRTATQADLDIVESHQG